MARCALRHHQRKNIFIFANQEDLRIFLICFFTVRAVTADGILLLSACGCRAADKAKACPHGLSRKRLQIGGTQKIL